MPPLPETILQFGSGRFLRAFADLFVHHANEQGQAVGRIVVVQSTGDGRAGGLNHQGGRYHVVVRGLEDGQVVDRVEECASISRALHAGTQWDDVLALAALAAASHDPVEHHRGRVRPRRRGRAGRRGAAVVPGEAARRPARPASTPGGRPTIIPCELIEGNAGILREHSCSSSPPTGTARRRSSAGSTDECVWLHTLVDRIVTGTPKDHPLLADRPDGDRGRAVRLLGARRPPALAVRVAAPGHHAGEGRRAVLPAQGPHPERRPHGAAHQGEAARASPSSATRSTTPSWAPGWGGCCSKRSCRRWRVGSISRRFAEQTIERFKNPFLDHKFADIALHHESKMRVRLVPTRDEFAAKFGKQPPLLTEVIDEGLRQLRTV